VVLTSSPPPVCLSQRGSVYAALTEGDLPLLVVHKETLSQKHRWSGPGGMVSIAKGGRHGFLHASVIWTSVNRALLRASYMYTDTFERKR
jgi:hypothetical protein